MYWKVLNRCDNVDEHSKQNTAVNEHSSEAVYYLFAPSSQRTLSAYAVWAAWKFRGNYPIVRIGYKWKPIQQCQSVNELLFLHLFIFVQAKLMECFYDNEMFLWTKDDTVCVGFHLYLIFTIGLMAFWIWGEYIYYLAFNLVFTLRNWSIAPFIKITLSNRLRCNKSKSFRVNRIVNHDGFNWHRFSIWLMFEAMAAAETWKLPKIKIMMMAIIV